jgi:cell division protein FtsI/penicillin-binding protein 2
VISSQDKLVRIGAIFGLALVIVQSYLLFVMTAQHESWLVRSYQNRWSFRDVPSIRGALLDRFDRPLSHDEPRFELSCIYERFRLLHPVAAAIHGASLWSSLRGDLRNYTYAAGPLGPEVAARDFLSLPVTALAEGVLPKEVRKALLQSAYTVLVACSERTKANVRGDLRSALQNPGMLQLGDVPGVRAVEDMEEQFAGILSRFRALDETLSEVLPPSVVGAPAETETVKKHSLIAQLDLLRTLSIEQRRTKHLDKQGIERPGELIERTARLLFANVPFTIAASVRVAASDQPGLLLEPSVLRVAAANLPKSLAQILGSTSQLDRGPPQGDKAWQRFEDYIDGRVDNAMADDLADLVPDSLTPLQDHSLALRDAALRSYEHLLRSSERRGSSGIEASLDAELIGKPGMRLIEHDAQSREQLLFGSLRVQKGNDVALTIDLDMQNLLDAEVQASLLHWQAEATAKGRDAARVDVACAVIDAQTGDVLALASSPTELDQQPRIPAALSWRGNGAIGSLLKPLFLVEQFAATATDLPHKDLGTFLPCNRLWHRVAGQQLECDGVHGVSGTRPEYALAMSCNVFFFQVAEGLEEAGLRRALWRFGMLPPEAIADDGRYQARPAELPESLCAAPRFSGRQLVQQRGIGYGIESNPLSLARAYAALATGVLPTIGLRRGEVRAGYSLLIEDTFLATVREGLRQCVQTGTAKQLMQLKTLAVCGKTGTAEIGSKGDNNAWFAGFLPTRSASGTQLCFCAVVYSVPDKTHGADAAGQLIDELFLQMAKDPELHSRYLREAGR